MPSPQTAGQLKVIISSTSLDLPKYRKAVMDAVLRAGCFPLAMEHGTATSDSDAIRFSLELVDRADIYVGIFAQRYGYVPDNRTDNPQSWSVTEHEYRRAFARGIPRLIFLAARAHKFSEEEVDFDPVKRAKLNALKEELSAQICGFFKSPETLHSLVVQSLFEEKAKHGPVADPEFRAGTFSHPPEFYTVPPYTLTSEFVGRWAELGELDAWAASPDRVMVVEAIGGMGKSALTWEWARQHAPTVIPGLAGRVWWSFYERGTSMKTFLRHTLAYVTRQAPEALLDLDTYQCGQQLVIALKRRPHLLVLDGFERVLSAYHRIDKAQMQDDKVPTDKRECTNPTDGDVLRQLVHCGPSKLLVSTRLMPRVLEDRFSHRPIPGVRHLELAGLAPGDVLEVARNAGVHTGAGILRLAEQFGHHPLVLRIVCGMITDYRPNPGDFDSWRADPYAGGGLRLSELPLVQRYTHILEYAFRGLCKKARQLLSRVALLSDGADYASIAVLNPFLPPRPKEVPEPADPLTSYSWESLLRQLRWADSWEERKTAAAEMVAYRAQHEPKYQAQRQAYKLYQEALRKYFTSARYRKAQTDFHAALDDLENRGLLQWNREANTYDLHPVVRAYAFERLEERDRTRTYDAIGDHFASLPLENMEEATELVHVKNSLEVMRVLIGANRFKQALSFYKTRAFSNSLLFSIGAYHIASELVSPLLRLDKDGAPLLADAKDRSYVTAYLGITLTYLGRFEESISMFYQQIRVNLESGQWSDLAGALRNLAVSLWEMNRLASSERADALAYELAVAVGDEDRVTTSFLEQMAIATSLGRFEDAKKLLASFRKREQPPLEICRPGQAEYWFVVLQFFQGRLVSADLEHAERVAGNGRNLNVRHRLAALRAEWELMRDNFTLALDATEHALTIVRRIGAPSAAYLGIRALALARLGQDAEAQEALVEAAEAWDGRNAQVPRFAAEAYLVLGDSDRAREFVRKAYPLAWCDGPPYIRWYELKRCRELLAELDEPEPQLSPFDSDKVEPLPFEAEVRELIEKLNAAGARWKRKETE